MTWALAVLIGIVIGAGAAVIFLGATGKDDTDVPKPSKKADIEYQRGYNAALAVLVDTDDNAAITEALGSGKIVPWVMYGDKTAPREQPAEKQAQERWSYQSSWDIKLYWRYDDANLTKAGIAKSLPTPREALAYYKSVRQQADAICEQLDAAEALRKEAREAKP